MALLNVDKLSVHFGDENAPFRAVDRISYSVKQGEVVGIVGESGSGKSVSSLAIMGLIDYEYAGTTDKNGNSLERLNNANLSKSQKTACVDAFCKIIIK